MANSGDLIFWINNDSEAHWPGLVNADGIINTTFFMPAQISGLGDVSPVFTTVVPATLNYACSLHPDETGAITVTSMNEVAEMT